MLVRLLLGAVAVTAATGAAVAAASWHHLRQQQRTHDRWVAEHHRQAERMRLLADPQWQQTVRQAYTEAIIKRIH